MRKLFVAVCVLAGLIAAPQAKALTAPEPAAAVSPPPELAPLLAATGGNLAVGRQPATGVYGMVRATRGAVLAPGTAAAPEATSRAFLSAHGHLLGMTSAEMQRVATPPVAGQPFTGGSELTFVSADVDKTTGLTRARFDQSYAGVPVFGGRVTVHIGSRGVTAVNGVFVPRISLERPAFSAADATRLALEHVAETGAADHGHDDGHAEWTANAAVAQVYNDGLVSLRPTPSRLVWNVELVQDKGAQQVVVDAATGAVINTIDLWHAAKDRCVYTPVYANPNGDDALAVRDEGESPTMVPPLDNLYDFSGTSYDLFADVFGRDSWDGKGHKMRTVYDATAVCPNAYWDGTQKITRFCPGFDVDDVVAHEWGHAYTQATHGLIYKNQPGALNESYSDIWGEVVDLTNGVDGIGGSDNTNPSPVGQRWIVGEDLKEVGAALGLRDMYNPESRKQPSKVSSATYVCGTGDNGGVHTNSAVPNHAFAMLVDGKTFNGQTISAIGMTKAAHIYYQAMVAYQTPTTGFLEHSSALRASCSDLTGIVLTPIPGDPAGQVITESDCAQVGKAIKATEMETPPVACGGPILAPGAPAPCPGGSTLFAEDWESGTDGWTIANVPVNPERWAGIDFTLNGDLPGGREGSAAFAQASKAAGCPTATVAGVAVNAPNKNPAGVVSITSPPITAAAGTTTLRFDHYVATEDKDGGNVMISVNNGPFVEVPATSYLHNAPNITLPSANPKRTQRAWSGVDTGVLTGSWGTSVADLSGVVKAGDTFRLRFEEGQDCTGGHVGWYVDDVAVLNCPIVTPPKLSLGADYGNPDPDGSYTLSWTRPAGATGPDTLEEGTTSAPIFADDAESGLAKWVTSAEQGAFEWRTSVKPGHPGTTFWAQANEASTGVSATLTSAAPVVIPAAGETVLTFKDWAYNHAGDKLVVEVSEDGAKWSQVFLRSTPYLTGAEAGFAADQLTARSASLGAFAGKSVFLRFRFTHGPEIYVDVTRFGWYVDDIAVSTLTWSPIATLSETSHTVTGRSAGTYLYRVSTMYGTRPSRLSNVVSARVS